MRRPMPQHFKGYVVAWCLMLLSVTSILIFAEQARRQAGQNRNIASEYRMHVEYQANAILSILTDCASRTATATGYTSNQPVIANRRPTPFPYFPQMPGNASDQGNVDLSMIACPIHDNGTVQPSPLFKAEQLSLPTGLGPWTYRNQQRAVSGQAAVEIQLTAADDSVVGRTTLMALYEKTLRNTTVQTRSHRITLSDPTQTGLTLSYILAEQP